MNDTTHREARLECLGLLRALFWEDHEAVGRLIAMSEDPLGLVLMSGRLTLLLAEVHFGPEGVEAMLDRLTAEEFAP